MEQPNGVKLRRGGQWRWVAVAIGGVAGVLAILFLLIVVFFKDPSANQFIVGAEMSEDGTVVLHVGDCAGGELRRLSVAVDATDDTEPPDSQVWSFEAAEDAGLTIAPEEVLKIEIGDVPAGMTESSPLRPLPADDRLQVDITTSIQSYGFFFRLSDLEVGRVWMTGRGATSPSDFPSVAHDVCGQAA